MKTSTLWALGGLGLAAAQVRIPFTRSASHEQHLGSGSSRRDTSDSFDVDMFSSQLTYAVNASLGTPPQQVTLLVSTGSMKTWVVDVEEYTSCAGRSNTWYCPGGSYNKSQSSTYAANTDDDYFSVSYLDGSYATGTQANETFELNGVKVPNMAIGLADSLSSGPNIGILGLGFNDSRHNSYPDELVNADAIKSATYSMWLDSPEAEAGSILFGAVDTAKFEGNMTRVYASKSASANYAFGMYLYGINGTNSTVENRNITSEDMPAAVYIGPGNSVSILPDTLVQQIWTMAGVRYDESYAQGVIQCSANTSDGHFAFELAGFGGPVIDVPIADLVFSEKAWTTVSTFDDDEDTEYCLFGIQNSSVNSRRRSSSVYSSDEGVYNIGSPLLRRTYLAFDLVNNQVGFAPVKFGVSDENVVAFETYGADMPQATPFCGPESYCPRRYSSGGSGNRYGDGDDDDYGYGGYYGSGSPLSASAIMGLSIGLGLGFLVVGLVVVWWCLRGGRQCCGARKREDPVAENQRSMAERSSVPQAAGPVGGGEQVQHTEGAREEPPTSSPPMREVSPMTTTEGGSSTRH